LKLHVGYNERNGHISEHLYKGHQLSITANFDQSLGWLLYTGFTVLRCVRSQVSNWELSICLWLTEKGMNSHSLTISGFSLGILGIATPFELGKIYGIFQCTASSLLTI